MLDATVCLHTSTLNPGAGVAPLDVFDDDRKERDSEVCEKSCFRLSSSTSANPEALLLTEAVGEGQRKTKRYW